MSRSYWLRLLVLVLWRSWFWVFGVLGLQSPELVCVDRLCSPEPVDRTRTYKTEAVTQLILMAQSSDEPVGTRTKVVFRSDTAVIKFILDDSAHNNAGSVVFECTGMSFMQQETRLCSHHRPAINICIVIEHHSLSLTLNRQYIFFLATTQTTT